MQLFRRHLVLAANRRTPAVKRGIAWHLLGACDSDISEFGPRTAKIAKNLRKNNDLAMSGNVLKFAKLSDKAFAPMKGSEYAAGYDLRSAYKYIIPAHGKELVKTDLQIEVPFGTYGRIAPRSGLAWKNHIDVGAGVIDADYRGNVGVILFNHSNEEFEVVPGDRIAQLICEKITYPKIEEVNTLNDTSRGAEGFGSTGMK